MKKSHSYPLVICYIAIENGPKFQDGESFHSYVKVYQAGYPGILIKHHKMVIFPINGLVTGES